MGWFQVATLEPRRCFIPILHRLLLLQPCGYRLRRRLIAGISDASGLR
jgi:hypothetical protein